MAMTVWYVPGWMRTQAPQPDVCEETAAVFPEAKVVFREWDGDQLLWPKAVANADAAVDSFVREIAALPQDFIPRRKALIIPLRAAGIPHGDGAVFPVYRHIQRRL